jgi:hypothetical protein
MTRKYIMKNHPNPKHIISWGLGLQSTALCVMSALEENWIRKVDYIITSDTLFEHSYSYKIRDFYFNYLSNLGMDIYIVNNGDIKNPGKHNELPLWTDKGSPLKRQCTGHFKITPIRRKTRELLNISLLNTGRTKKGSVIMYLGITYDESERIKESNRNYIINYFPLVDLKYTREDCISYLKEKNLPVPNKSCCIHCPYQGAKQWDFIKENYPEDFALAIEYDEKIRKPTKSMIDRGIYSGNLYLWSKSIPLRDVNFSDLVDSKVDICDEGYCFI